MELPLSRILGDMEITGIRVDATRLKEMQVEFSERLKEIEEKIYAEAGEEFNLNSPKQLGVILFEKMGLPVIKKDENWLFNSGRCFRTTKRTSTNCGRYFNLSSNCQNSIDLC